MCHIFEHGVEVMQSVSRRVYASTCAYLFMFFIFFGMFFCVLPLFCSALEDTMNLVSTSAAAHFKGELTLLQ